MAEHKVKTQKNGNVHVYDFYRCDKYKNKNCGQKYMNAADIEKQIADVLANIEIPKEFHDWAVNELRQSTAVETAARDVVLSAHRKNYDACVRKLDTLIDMRASEQITQEQFEQKKEVLLSEKEKLQALMKDVDYRVEHWLEYAEQALSFAATARAKFENSDNDIKRQIVFALGSNFILTDKKLTLSLAKPLLVLEKAAKEVKRIHGRLELHKTQVDTRVLEESYEKNPVLGAWVKEVRTCLAGLLQ